MYFGKKFARMTEHNPRITSPLSGPGLDAGRLQDYAIDLIVWLLIYYYYASDALRRLAS